MPLFILILVIVIIFIAYHAGKRDGRKEALKDLNKACDIALKSVRDRQYEDMTMPEITKEVLKNLKSGFKKLIGG